MQSGQELVQLQVLHTLSSPLKGVGPRRNGEIMTRCLGMRTLKEYRRFLTLQRGWPTTLFDPLLPSPPLSLDSSDPSSWHALLGGGGASSLGTGMRGGGLVAR